MNHNTLDARVHLQEKVWSRVVFVQIVVGNQHGMHFSSTAMLIQILFFFHFIFIHGPNNYTNGFILSYHLKGESTVVLIHLR